MSCTMLFLPRRPLAGFAILLAVGLGFGQETREPPLADPNAPVALPASQKGTGLQPASLAGVPTGPPVVTLTLSGPAASPVGKEIDYTITVVNGGAGTAYQVTVRNKLPAAGMVVKPPLDAQQTVGNDVIWTVGTLAPGGRKEIKYTLRPADGPGDLRQCAVVTFESGQCLTTRVSPPSMEAKRSGPAEIQVGESATFKLEVTNNGHLDLLDVEVLEPLPSELEYLPDPAKPGADRNTRGWKIARLGAGQSQRIEYQAKAVKVAPTVELVGLAKATGVTKLPVQTKLAILEPKLELKFNGPTQREAHLPAKYTVDVRNSGIGPVQNVRIAHKLASGCQVTAASDGASDFGSELQWIVPSLAVGAKKTVEFSIRHATTGPAVQQVTASVPDCTVSAEARTQFEAIPVVPWDARVSQATVEVGGRVEFVVRVKNEGSAPLRAMLLAVKGPPELTFERAEPTSFEQTAGTISFPVSDLKVGERREYRLVFTARQPAVGATISAGLQSTDWPAGPVIKQESVTVSGSGQTTTAGQNR